MKRLEQQYTKNGYEHHLIWRDDEYAITEVRDPKSKKVLCFEAFEIKKNKDIKIGEKNIEAWESSPSNEEWGVKGYTTHNFVQAQLRVGKMRTNKQDKNNKKWNNGKKLEDTKNTNAPTQEKSEEN